MFDEALFHLGLSSEQNNPLTLLLLGASRGCHALLLSPLTSRSLWLGPCDMASQLSTRWPYPLLFPLPLSFLLSASNLVYTSPQTFYFEKHGWESWSYQL